MKTKIALLLALYFGSFTLPAQTAAASTYITNKSYFASKGLLFVPSGSYTNAEGETRSVQAPVGRSVSLRPSIQASGLISFLAQFIRNLAGCYSKPLASIHKNE